MAEFVTLSCPSCGGKLQITNDIEQFACSYCGQEHAVKRSGGIVSLAPVVDAIKKVGAGVDKTAAELAIVRLKQEIAAARSELERLRRSSPRPVKSTKWLLPLVIGGAFTLGFFCSLEGSTNITGNLLWLGLGLLFIASGVLSYRDTPEPDIKYWQDTTGAQLKSLEAQIASKMAELQKAHDTVSGN